MNEKYMKLALEQAEIALLNGDVPVGAIIVKGNEIIARAYNKKEKNRDATDHAEIIAIREACRYLKDWRLNGCIMYVTLEPCPMCLGAIQQSRIEKIVFGTKNTKDIDNQFVDAEGSILDIECSKLLKSFFQNRRNE
ncbi:MAG: nucleoside deaminase [Bacilli bacterium]|jgi:tRNA(adenine34) deaminase